MLLNIFKDYALATEIHTLVKTATVPNASHIEKLRQEKAGNCHFCSLLISGLPSSGPISISKT